MSQFQSKQAPCRARTLLHRPRVGLLVEVDNTLRFDSAAYAMGRVPCRSEPMPCSDHVGHAMRWLLCQCRQQVVLRPCRSKHHAVLRPCRSWYESAPPCEAGTMRSSDHATCALSRLPTSTVTCSDPVAQAMSRLPCQSQRHVVLTMQPMK